MADLEKTYAVADAPASNLNNFAPLPDGDYNVIIIDSEMKPTKAGTGKYLQITIEILDAEHKGRRVWSRLNLINPNATAVEIAERDLADICRAVGKQSVADSVELHDIPFVVALKTRPASNGYEATNEVASYKPARGADGKVPIKTQPAAQPWGGDSSSDDTPF